MKFTADQVDLAFHVREEVFDLPVVIPDSASADVDVDFEIAIVELFAGYEGVGNVLFVNTKKEIEILTERSEQPTETEEKQKEPEEDAPAPPTTNDTKPKNGSEEP